VLESALQILRTGGPNNEPLPLELLPKSPASTDWLEIQNEYGLSLAQKLALQKYVSGLLTCTLKFIIMICYALILHHRVYEYVLVFTTKLHNIIIMT